MKKIWFRRKRYGWGWTPATWQGWLILAVYLVLVIAITVRQLPDGNIPVRITPFILLTIILIALCSITGETPRWQWGNKTPENKD